MNAKISVFVICVEAIIYLLLHNLYGFTFKFETDFPENKNPFQKTGVHYFHTKLPYQKPMLRQIEWRVQNGPITKNGVLSVTLFF